MADWLGGGVPRRAAYVLAAVAIALLVSVGLVGHSPLAGASTTTTTTPASATPAGDQATQGQCEGAPPTSTTDSDMTKAPSHVNAKESKGGLSISWIPPDNSTIVPDAYCVYVSDTTGGDQVTSCDAAKDSCTFQLKARLTGTSLFVWVRAHTLGTYTPPWSMQTTVSSSGNPQTVPTAPTLERLVPENQALAVTVRPGYNGGSPVITYEWSRNGGRSWTPTHSAATSFTIPRLVNGAPETIIVRAKYAIGNSEPSSPRTATPAAVSKHSPPWVAIGAGLLVIVGVILLLRRRSSERPGASRNLDRGAAMNETDDMFLRSSNNFRGKGAGEASGDGGYFSEVPVVAVIDDAAAPVAPSELSAAAPPPTQAPAQALVPVTATAPSGVDVAFMSAESSPDLGGRGAFRVHPQIGDEGVIWSVAQGAVLGAGLWSEKRSEFGEDAEPSFLCKGGRRLFVGVYDGMGGSGGAIARQTRRGPVTQAYDASRITRAVAERWFSGLPDGALDGAGAAGSLHDDLVGELTDRATTLVGVTSGLVGTLKRTLPSTIATVVVETDRTATRLTALWAGDSRCYVLTPSRGLQQISRDDTAIQDSLAALLADPPLDNVVCADRNFTIHHAVTVETEPVVVVVASDGCFGYVPSPPLFEYQVLSALMSVGSAGEWMRSLLDVLGHQAQDDTSLAVAAIGFPDFATVKDAFRGRFHELEATVGQPYRECSSSPDRQAFEHFRTSTWEAYKPGYEARIPETAVVP